ncbi:hypothetical protein [Alkalimarinus alittae]|uniref:Uncharacterized protein n=1 Tax=Alkalimarinus alittae TaxID=2961619 RepID=A0ABY6MZJ7_9ALTE|nr:hypothetical protein [Alkalimarinus alittae]UZE95182.1 hypothetical protein NKI27_14065 [Alkalimarinus alittae]
MLTLDTTLFRSTTPLRIYTSAKQALLCLSLLVMFSLLSGCGGGNEAVKAAGKTKSTFARNTESANEEIAQNGTSDTTACTGTGPSAVTYCLVVEATDTMIASWQSDLFNLITPSKAYALRGLSTVPAQSIEIIQVDENLNQISNSTIPAYTVTENPALGTYSINFSESPPARIDIIAKVTLENDEILLAPFIDSSIDQNFNPIVIVNVVSDFLVKRLYKKLNTPEALNELLPCNDGGSNYGNNVGCKNQPFAKFNLWAALNGLTQSYEIDIPATYNISEAFDLLDKTGEFKAHIDTTLDEIIRTQEAFVGGTEREVALSTIQNDPESLTVKKEYNSTLFSLAFNQTNPGSSLKGASISTTISSPFTKESDAVSYPALTRNTTNFNISVTNLIEDFPMLRISLSIDQASDVLLSPALNNALTASPSNTFLTSQGFYIVGKMPFQTITDKTSSSAIGWQSDPYTQLVYSSDSDTAGPQSMLSAFIRNGGKYSISDNGDSTWTRNNQLEEQNIFAWNNYNQTDGATAVITSNTYGVISFSVNLSETGNVLTTAGEVLHWDAETAQSISQTQPSVALLSDNHYQRYSFSRAESLDLTVAASSRNAIAVTRSYEDLDSDSSPKGRISVSAPGSTESSLATVTPAGDLITVALNESDAGQGLITALETRTIKPTSGNLTGAVYRLAGNSFGANAASNVLRHYNNSTIKLTSGSTAILTLNTLESTHNVSTQTVTDISEVAISSANGNYTVNNDGLIQFIFPTLNLELKGFMSKSLDGTTETNEPGNVLSLLMIQDYDDVTSTQATLGLIYALRELSLDVTVE